MSSSKWRNQKKYLLQASVKMQSMYSSRADSDTERDRIWISDPRQLKGLKLVNSNNTLILEFKEDGVYDTNIICVASVLGKAVSILIGLVVFITVLVTALRKNSKDSDVNAGRAAKSVCMGMIAVVIGWVVTWIVNSTVSLFGTCGPVVTGKIPYEYISTTTGHFSIIMNLFNATPEYIKEVAKGDMLNGQVAFDNYDLPTRVGQKGMVNLTIYQASPLMAFVARVVYGFSANPAYVLSSGNSTSMGYEVFVSRAPEFIEKQERFASQ